MLPDVRSVERKRGAVSLTVVPDDLDDFARLLGRAGDDAEAIHAHARRYGAISLTSKGFIALVKDCHQEFYGPLCTQLGELSHLLENAERQVRLAASRYRSTDLEAAQRLDGALPPTRR
ncbi:type VII secretion target [Actinopolymorpha sp. NPDC004070]|uniref:type VII secretion target n=1 Tax=Actinopolymorpha sp. NPDC004070 TaxID=3154548 RepID=UPI0033AB9CD1